MLSPTSRAIVDTAVQAVQQRRAAASITVGKGTSGGGVSTKTSGVRGLKPAAKPKPKAKPKPSPQQDTQQITPYLTAADLLGVSQQAAATDNTQAAAQHSYAAAAANAAQAQGDIERERVAGVAGAADDAASRGIYNSGIRLGAQGMANTGAARAQTLNQGGLALAAQQATQQHNAAGQQQTEFMQIMAAKAAENGAALPVDPYGGNVPGAATLKRAKPKPKPGAKPRPKPKPRS